MRSHKGITAVVAIVLLLMMTVGAAGLAYVFVKNLQGNIQDSTSASVKQVTNQQSARLSIDSMWNETNIQKAGNITFMLRNAGTYAFTSDDMSKLTIYVNGVPATANFSYATGAFTPKNTIPVNTTVAYPSVGSSKTIKITTPLEGVDVSYTCQVNLATDVSC